MAAERAQQRFRDPGRDAADVRPVPKVLPAEALGTEADVAVELLQERAADELPEPKVHLDDERVPDRGAAAVQQQRHAVVGRAGGGDGDQQGVANAGVVVADQGKDTDQRGDGSVRPEPELADPCCCCGDVSADLMFCAGFKSKKIRVNLNLPIKAEVKAESSDVLKTVDEDRKYVIQATIVRWVAAK